jgi:flagellar biosynthesis component FlhA
MIQPVCQFTIMALKAIFFLFGLRREKEKREGQQQQQEQQQQHEEESTSKEHPESELSFLCFLPSSMTYV